MRDRAALEQFPVAGKNNASVMYDDSLDFAVVIVVIVKGIETSHPQQMRQSAKMGISDKAHHAQRMLAHAQQGRDVDHLEFGEDGNAVAVFQQSVESYGLTVDQYQFYFGVRYAQRLDHMLGRCCPGARTSEFAPAPFGRKEIVELLVEAECRSNHGESIALFSRRCSGVAAI